VTRRHHTPSALPEDLRRRVQTALLKQNLLPQSEKFVRTLTRITRHGTEYRAQLLGSGAWRRGLSSSELGYSSATLARILGFGAAMTRFSIAWIPMSPVHRRNVTRLGALSNLIVSLYDQLADAMAERDLLSRAALIGALGRARPSERYSPGGSAYGAMIGHAVETYARMLHDLPYCDERPAVRRSVIATMRSRPLSEGSDVASPYRTGLPRLPGSSHTRSWGSRRGWQRIAWTAMRCLVIDGGFAPWASFMVG